MKALERVMLVDDDTVTNMLHTRVIERSGRVSSICVATDGEEALGLIESDLASGVALPELILLDINMPGMGGFEFLEIYQKLVIPNTEQLIIVMLSTSLLKADHDRAAADPNVHSFCEKPMRHDKLIELIEAFQGSRSARGAAA